VNNTFRWLDEELGAIKTIGFHSVQGPSVPKFEHGDSTSSQYFAFVKRFGETRLYRSRGGSHHRIGVFAYPKPVRSSKKKPELDLVKIGFYEDEDIFLNRTTDLVRVKKGRGWSELPFDRWLHETADKVRATYSDQEWEAIIRGPAPFSRSELSVVKARSQFEWSHEGVNPKGDQLLKVRNRSERQLSVLTLGVKTTDGRLNGALAVDVSGIAPGEEEVRSVSCYRGLVPPKLIELYDLEEPTPHNRSLFFELGAQASGLGCKGDSAE